MTDIVNADKLYLKVKPLIPINFRYVNSVYLVGSFANPNKEIDRDGKISDIDIFMNIDNDADSISCIKGKYGRVNIDTNTGLI